jgi:hypothetical protein
MACGLAALALATPVFAQDPAPLEPAPATSGRMTYSLGVGYMLQASARREYAFTSDRFDDGESYVFYRLRPRFAGSNRRVDFVLEGQDTHAHGGRGARKAWLDVLNGYAVVRPAGGWSLKAGRQEANIDVISRMARTPDFAAVFRSFDIAEVRWQGRAGGGRADLRAFAFRMVDNLPARFNREKAGEYLWATTGNYARGRYAAQGFLLARHNASALGENGTTGNAQVYAWQGQLTGPTPYRSLTWTLEGVLERGHVSTDGMRAWAMFLGADAVLPRKATLYARVARTSGDAARGDGVRGTYDTFYGAASAFGSLGQIKGSNIQSTSIGGALPVARPLTLNWRYLATFLTTRTDVWYASATPNIASRNPHSSFLGQETNLTLIYSAASRLQVRLAYHQFFMGRYAQPAPSGSPHEFRLQLVGNL